MILAILCYLYYLFYLRMAKLCVARMLRVRVGLLEEIGWETGRAEVGFRGGKGACSGRILTGIGALEP